MLNDVPTTAFYTYNPAHNPTASAALRARLLDETPDNGADGNSGPDDDSVPDSNSGPDNNSDLASNPETHQTPSAPSTPRRQPSGGATQSTPGRYNVTFAPVVELRLNSPGPSAYFFFHWLSSKSD